MVATLIEPMKKNKIKECPFLLECNTPITKNFFYRICSSAHFQNCHHYARKKDELKTPLIWLQKKAILLEEKKKETKLTKIFPKKSIE
jgi:hypothetical protein